MTAQTALWQLRQLCPRPPTLLAALLLAGADPALAEAPAQPDRVEVILADLSNPFFTYLARQIELSLLRHAPDSETIVRSSGYDLTRQQRQIREAVAAGADFLIVNAVDSSGLVQPIAEARAAGTPVIAVDVDALGADAVIASDNHEAGRLACAYIAKRLSGHGRVLMLYGPAVTAVTERNAGCREVLAGYPGIGIHSETGDSGGSRLGGLTYMSMLLPQLPRIDAVFSFNDPTTLGVAQAAREAGWTEFFIVSVDASPEGLRAMASADSPLEATVAQYPTQMAETAVATALALFRGDKLPARAISIPVTLVTRDMLRNDLDYWMQTQ